MSFARWRDRLLLAALAFLPWQARFIKEDAELNGFPWELGTVSLFAVELLIWTALIAHVLAGVRAKDVPRREPSSALRLWALLLLYAAISVFWSADTLTGIFTWIRLFDGFALAYLLWNSDLPIRTGLKAFLIGAALAAAVGIAQFFSQSAGASTLLGMAAHDPAVSGTSVVDTGKERFLRAYGPLPHPNVLGGYLAVGLAAAAGLAVDAESRRARRLLQALAGILTVGLLVTFSRSAWLAAAACLLAAGVFGRAASDAENRPRLRAAFAAVALFGGIFLAILWPAVSTRVAAQGRLEALSFDERAVAFAQAEELFRRHPGLGVGVGNMAPAAYGELEYLGHDFVYQPAHFLPALAAAELGFFGLMMLIGLALAWAYETRSAFRAAVKPLTQFALVLPLAVVIVGLFDHYPVTQLSGTLLVGFCLGLCFKAQDAVMAPKPD